MARTKFESILVNRGLNQTDLYNLIVKSKHKEIGKDRINKMVTGVFKNYNVNTLLVLCDVLNVTPNDIVDYETNRLSKGNR